MKMIAEWKCKNGHVMGVVVRMGRGIENLLLYREAVGDCHGAKNAPRNDINEEVEVMAVVVGMARGVKCSICGVERTWVP